MGRIAVTPLPLAFLAVAAFRRPAGAFEPLNAALQITAILLVILPPAFGAGETEPEPADTASGTISFASLAPRRWDLYQTEIGGATARITRTTQLDYNAAFSPDGTKLAFVSDRDGNVELYSMNVDGTGVHRLTTNQAMDDHPSWSPDGRRIAFCSTRKPAAPGHAWNGIYVMDADGANVHRISRDDAVADYSPAWSPRNDLIAFASGRDRARDVYVMKPDGTGRRQVARDGGWPAFVDGGRAIVFHRRGAQNEWDLWRVALTENAEPELLTGKASMPRATADGTKLVAVTYRGPVQHVALIDPKTGDASEVVAGDIPLWNPTISPDGRSVIYHRETPGQARPNAEWWGAPPGTKLKLLRLDGSFPAFSPDASRVAFVGENFATVDVMKVDGSARTTIFKGSPRSLFALSWSRDPERIAFSQGSVFAPPSSSVNLRAVSPDGGEVTDITSDAGNNGFPSYSPDGKRMVFRSGRDGFKNLYIMDRDGSHVRRLTEGDWTDTMCNWSHDGRWIAFASDRENDFEIWLVRPDGSELHKLIGGGGRNNHPHFSPDDRWIVFTSQRAGFSAETVSLPRQPQPYGELFIIRIDGTRLTRLTHNGFEEGTPAWAKTHEG